MSEHLKVAEKAAREAGALLRENYGRDLQVDAYEDHDIKLALDVRSQELITGVLLGAFPEHMVLGEEGDTGADGAEYQWIVDPIDGTVNYFYGIPHFCVSIALRRGADDYLAGVIYDPMLDEMWAVEAGAAPTLNGVPISVSKRERMAEAVVTVGFAKTKESMDAGFERYKQIAYQVRKSRMMGSAALAMAYIACGRMDAYIEEVISIWDIAAGKMLIEAAGGKVNLVDSVVAPGKLSICSWNGRLPLGDVMSG